MGWEWMPLGNEDDDRLRLFGTRPCYGSARQIFRRGDDHGTLVEAALLDKGLKLLQADPEVGHQQHGKRASWFGKAARGRRGDSGALRLLGQPCARAPELQVPVG